MIKSQKKHLRELIKEEGFDNALLVHHDARYISHPYFSELLAQLELISFDLNNVFQFNYPEYFSQISSCGLYNFIIFEEFYITDMKTSRLIRIYKNCVEKIESFLEI